MPRDRKNLTPGMWEHLGSLVGDFLWDQEKFHAILYEFLHDQGVSEKRMSVITDEVFRRVEEGFNKKEK